MNIFVLNNCPIESAKIQHDKHIVKMVLESAQMLCSAFDQDKFNVPYKKAHYNHTCTIWCRETLPNFKWLVKHGIALAEEYTHRYKKIHKSQAVIEWCLDNVSKIDIQNSYITPFAQAMPDKYKSENAVKSYINYYIGEKLNNAKWTNRNIPNLFQDYFDSVKN